MAAPQVSVVILNWNTCDLLKQFLPIVVEKCKQPWVEVVLTDNGSTDDSVEWVKANLPDIRIIALPENYGFAEGYNQALAQIDSEFSVLLNSDAAPAEGWLEPLLETILNNPKTAACVPKIMSFNNPNTFEYAGATGGFIDCFGYPFCRGRIFNISETDTGQYDKPGKVFWGSGSALMVRTALFRETGGLDHDFFAHMEEIDWCWRVKNQGYDIRYVPTSVIYHLGGGTLSYMNPRKTFLNFRNNMLLIFKNKPGLSGWATLLFRFFLDYVAMIKFFASHEYDFARAVPKAHWSFLEKFSYYHKKRCALMPLVTKSKHPETYNGSIVVDFFLRNRKYYSQIKFNPEKNRS
jgi:GT2 family glycosyltransferase